MEPPSHYVATCSRDSVKIWNHEGDALKDSRPIRVRSPRAVAWNHSCKRCTTLRPLAVRAAVTLVVRALLSQAKSLLSDRLTERSNCSASHSLTVC